MNWTIKTFEQLTSKQLYQILQARVDVFVVEQNCPYREIDDIDQESIHFFIEEQDKIVAYARIIPKGLLYDSASIGRILVHKDYRKHGYGRKLLEACIDWVEENWNEKDIILHAQVYLREFYRSFGFVEITETYLEDGIPHVEMLRSTLVSNK